MVNANQLHTAVSYAIHDAIGSAYQLAELWAAKFRHDTAGLREVLQLLDCCE